VFFVIDGLAFDAALAGWSAAKAAARPSLWRDESSYIK
jgi:hypothetical protein